MSEIIVTNRSNLLRTITDMNFPQSTKHEIMLLFGSIKTHSEKERVAEKCISLVKNCKTEQEAIEAVKTVIQQMI